MTRAACISTALIPCRWFLLIHMYGRIALLSTVLIFVSACYPAVAPGEGAVSTSPATVAPSATQTESPTAKPAATQTRPFIVEQTKYEGAKTYTCDAGGCWRDDGAVTDAPPESFYPDIDADTPAVRALLASIGLPAGAAPDGAERWRRIREVWEWMTRETVIDGEKGSADPWDALMELSSAPSDHWPTIGEMAEIWRRFGVLPLGACHSKAFTMATLLYRAGIGRGEVASLAGRGFGLTQHFYVGVRVDGRWLYVDPSCIRQQMRLPPNPASFGCLDTDYRHPFSIQPLPGSRLAKPMLLE